MKANGFVLVVYRTPADEKYHLHLYGHGQMTVSFTSCTIDELPGYVEKYGRFMAGDREAFEEGNGE